MPTRIAAAAAAVGLCAALYLDEAPGTAARADLPPGPPPVAVVGAGPCPLEPQPTHASLVPRTVEVPIPYPAVTAVPFPAPPPASVRIDQPPLPANTCADPCPDLTDAVVPAGGSAELPIPKLILHPQPFYFAFPLPGPKPAMPPPPTVYPPTAAAPLTAAPPAPVVRDVTEVAKETGEHSINRTDKRWQVQGTDLGIMWESAPGEIATVFGDTIGSDFHPPGGMGGDWRSNVLAFSTNRDLSHGMVFDRMVLDSRCHAAELLHSRKLDNVEITTIPTSGFALGNRQYLSYMSIRTWNSLPGTMFTNYGGIAYSDDHGQTWVEDPYAHWDNIFGLAKFQVSAMVPHGDYVYMFGTPNTRLGAVAVARVPKTQVLNKSAYQYWSNGEWTAVGGAAAATPIADAPAGELSVRYNEDRKVWQMSYLDTAKAAITLREARSPQGRWSDNVPLVGFDRFPELYGGFIHPWSTGRDLYFTLSTWSDYNVYLLHAVVG